MGHNGVADAGAGGLPGCGDAGAYRRAAHRGVLGYAYVRALTDFHVWPHANAYFWALADAHVRALADTSYTPRTYTYPQANAGVHSYADILPHAHTGRPGGADCVWSISVLARRRLQPLPGYGT